MADNLDLSFLGEQMTRLQADMRTVKGDVAQLRADQARIEGDQAEMRSELHEVRQDIRHLEASVNARFDQVHQTLTSNTQVLLSAIDGLKR
jgi:predicted  nucleic acid-binding Zn-ribbon protein